VRDPLAVKNKTVINSPLKGKNSAFKTHAIITHE
jgi:hypothetical protein